MHVVGNDIQNFNDILRCNFAAKCLFFTMLIKSIAAKIANVPTGIHIHFKFRIKMKGTLQWQISFTCRSNKLTQ